MNEMNNRFAYVTEPVHFKFNPIYVVATALDPRFRLSLTAEQLDAAKTEILRLVRFAIHHSPRNVIYFLF